jgi:transposase
MHGSLPPLSLSERHLHRSNLCRTLAPASSIQREQPAVQAALTLPYSNGQVEGQITTLKLLKRQSYGRAKLDLLRQRMLHAA